MQCIRCGKEEGPSGLVRGLCADCFVETEKPVAVPEHITVLQCASCGSVLKGKTWTKGISDEELGPFALGEHVSVRPGTELVGLDGERGKGDDNSFDLVVRARLQVGQNAFERSFPTHIKVRRSLCDVCSRRAGSYFEAIVQVRGFDAPLDREHQERIRATVEDAVARLAGKEREVFLTKSEEVQGGLDFYLSSTSAAQRIAASLRDELGATLVRSGKIAGVKDGSELQRTTFSVRLPKFIRQDVLTHAERIFRVAKVHPKSIVVTDLESGIQENKSEDWIRRAVVPGKEAILQDAVVVSVAGEELQVLDPVNFATVTLANWPRHEAGTEKVPVVRYRGRLYLAG